MKRMFKESGNVCDIIKIFDYDNNLFTLYYVDKGLGCTFGATSTHTVQEMGYKSIEDCYKQIKNRGLIHQELNIEDQLESERIGFIKLGVFRLSRNLSINDVVEKLNTYGMSKQESEYEINKLLNVVA